MVRKVRNISFIAAVGIAATVALVVFMMSTRPDEFFILAKEMPNRLLTEKVRDLSLSDIPDAEVLLPPRAICRIRVPPFMGEGKLAVSSRANSDGGAGKLFYGVYTETGKLVGAGMGSLSGFNPSPSTSGTSTPGTSTHYTRFSPETARNAYLLFVNEGETPVRLHGLRVEFK